jgi:hypothetical protein
MYIYIYIYYINISIDYCVETSLHVRVITSVLASSSNQWSFGEKSIMWANYKNRKPANLGVTSKRQLGTGDFGMFGAQ